MKINGSRHSENLFRSAQRKETLFEGDVVHLQYTLIEWSYRVLFYLANGHYVLWIYFIDSISGWKFRLREELWKEDRLDTVF